MNQIALLNFDDVTDEEALGFRAREAVRAVVCDQGGKVALLHARVNSYYKLPGGGIEKEENIEEALRRECLEEIGCEVEIGEELGMIVEYRKQQNLRQTSYCYLAKLVGEKGKPNFTQSEINEGFEAVWLPLDEAIAKLKQGHSGNYMGDYMATRDLKFLETAAKIIV